MTRKIFIASLIAASAAILTLDLASARGGGHGGGNHGMTSRGPISATQPKADRPAINFTRLKLLKCHKYARGTGQGGPVNWVTVCS